MTQEGLRLAELDLADLDDFASGFPHAFFDVHRREAPVWWLEPTSHTPEGEGFWSVATYAETLHVPRGVLVGAGGTRPYGGTALKDLEIAGVAMNMMDDPRHARIRRLVTGRMTPRVIGRLEAVRGFEASTCARVESVAPVDIRARRRRGQGHRPHAPPTRAEDMQCRARQIGQRIRRGKDEMGTERHACGSYAAASGGDRGQRGERRPWLDRRADRMFVTERVC